MHIMLNDTHNIALQSQLSSTEIQLYAPLLARLVTICDAMKRRKCDACLAGYKWCSDRSEIRDT